LIQIEGRPYPTGGEKILSSGSWASLTMRAMRGDGNEKED